MHSYIELIILFPLVKFSFANIMMCKPDAVCQMHELFSVILIKVHPVGTFYSH